MLIVVSPAKKMNDAEGAFAAQDLPLFVDRAEELARAVGELSLSEAQKLWGCSDRLAALNYERFRTIDVRAADVPAVLAYEGLQYQHLAASVMTASQMEYLQNHLRILSGLYGVLKPLDAVVPYRLEMQAKLAMGECVDLYHYWGSDVRCALAAEDELVVNVASVEYARVVDGPVAREAGRAADLRMVTCLFGTISDAGTLLQRSTAAKAARGSFVRWCAENEVESVEGLVAFSQLGHSFCEAMSTSDTLVFTRD